jgi:branched-chain amino acid transport system permease protein
VQNIGVDILHPFSGGIILSEFLLVQTLNGLSFGALLFLLASGLSLIYGVMKIVNIAHGSYFMLGAYVGLSVILRTKSFILGAFAGGLVVGVIGMIMERGFLRKFPLKALPQMMITLGFALVLEGIDANLSSYIPGLSPFRH